MLSIAISYLCLHKHLSILSLAVAITKCHTSWKCYLQSRFKIIIITLFQPNWQFRKLNGMCLLICITFLRWYGVIIVTNISLASDFCIFLLAVLECTNHVEFLMDKGLLNEDCTL